MSQQVFPVYGVSFSKLLFGLVLFLIISCLMPDRAFPSFGAPENKELYKLPTIYQDASIRVVSDELVSKADGKKVADIVKKALQFDCNALSLTRKRTDTQQSLCVAILSPEYIKDKMHTDFGGQALETDLFAAKSSTYKNDKDRFCCVVAHELVHILVYRFIWELNPRSMGWTRSLDEGLAQNIGQRYALANQRKLYPSMHFGFLIMKNC